MSDAAGTDGGLASVAIALAAEIAAAAAPEEAAGLLGALGSRIADAHPVQPAPTIGALQEQLTARFAALGWGQCALTPTDRALEIAHRGWPRPKAAVAARDWQAAFPIILAAVYGRWFAMLGAPPALVVRILSIDDDVIALRQN